MGKNSPGQKVSGTMDKMGKTGATVDRDGLSGGGVTDKTRGGVVSGEGKLPTTVGPRGTLATGAK